MGHMGERGCQGETKEHRRGPKGTECGGRKGTGGDRGVGGELRVAEGDRVSSERTNGGPRGDRKAG